MDELSWQLATAAPLVGPHCRAEGAEGAEEAEGVHHMHVFKLHESQPSNTSSDSDSDDGPNPHIMGDEVTSRPLNPNP